MSKHIIIRALIFAAVALSALTSCSKDGIKSQKVAVLLPDNTIINRWAEDKQNLETVMGKYGFNATFYTAPETVDGAALQVQQMKTAIEGGAKFIVLTAIDYKTINESGLLAKYPDVKFVCHDRLLLDNPHIAYVSSADTKEIGHIQALYLLNHFHSSGASSMTIDKNLNDMAYNTAMIINCLMAGAPVQSSHSISVGSVKIPVFYSKNTLITIDSI